MVQHVHLTWIPAPRRKTAEPDPGPMSITTMRQYLFYHSSSKTTDFYDIRLLACPSSALHFANQLRWIRRIEPERRPVFMHSWVGFKPKILEDIAVDFEQYQGKKASEIEIGLQLPSIPVRHIPHVAKSTLKRTSELHYYY